MLITSAPAPCLAVSPDSESKVEIARPAGRSEQLDAYQVLAEQEVADVNHSVPVSSRLNLYLGLEAEAALEIQSIRVLADDGLIAFFELPPDLYKAIDPRGGRYRFARVVLASGPHDVRVEILMRAGANESAQTKRLTALYRLNKNVGEADLEARVKTRVGVSSAISLRQLHKMETTRNAQAWSGLARSVNTVFAQPAYRAGSEADPAVAHALSLSRGGDLDAAMIEILAIAQMADAPSELAPDYWLLRARVLRQLGLLDEAEQIADQLSAISSIAAVLAAERLQIANARIAAGDLEQAQRQLQLARPGLPKLMLPDWRYAAAMRLFAAGQAAEAVAMIGEPDQTVEALRAIENSVDALQSRDYTRFNLAVAMLRSGQEQQGLTWLDLLGRSKALDAESLALRDRANLALGWHFLRRKQGRTAMGILGRVSSEGLFARSALLGLGWAQLEPNGERLSRNRLDTGRSQAIAPTDLPASVKRNLVRMAALEPELSGAIEPASFERDDPPKNRNEGLKRALYIWSGATMQDPRDAAVQEASLASAYAYDQLGDSNAARKAYADAIARLQAVEQSISAQLLQLEDDAFFSAIAAADSNVSLYRLMDQFGLPADDATASLYAAVDAYRGLTRLQSRLLSLQASADDAAASDQSSSSAFADRIAASTLAVSARQVHAREQVRGEAEQVLQGSQLRVRNYWKSALLAAARIESQPDRSLREGGAAEIQN